jgi:mannosyl-oligosaccharide alpha-1,2-mannosidase
MALLPRALRGRLLRNALLAVIGVFVFYRYFSSSAVSSTATGSWARSGNEFSKLTRFMNSGPDTVVGNKSSFNWSRVSRHKPSPSDPETYGANEQPLTDSGSGSRSARPTVPKYVGKGHKPATSRKRPRIQHVFGPESAQTRKQREARRDEVRSVFARDWAAYRQHAWGMDSLKPLSLVGSEQFCGWSATLVDALDTLWLMGLKAEFDEAVEAVASLDFGRATCMQVNTFETTIRYLGGLLGAYDLSGREVLLTKAREMGDLLIVAFNTRNGMPVDFMSFSHAKTGSELMVEASVVSASPGTLVLELAHLSQVTGDSKYYEAVKPVMELFADGQNRTKLPGLWPMYVSMGAMDVVTGGFFTLSGGADSLYEYLPKMHSLLLGEKKGGVDDGEGMYEDMSLAFLKAANESLVFRPMAPGAPDVLISGYLEINNNNEGLTKFTAQSEHLACFIGGIWALSGRLFQQPGLVDTGVKMARGCAWTYKAMPTGVGPERFNLVPCKSRQQCPWDEADFLRRAKATPQWRDGAELPPGFVEISDKRYILRPEAIESVFVLWRITGRQEFQDAAWAMWKGVRDATNTGNITAAVKDVTTHEHETEKDDYMESFWFAETLKYFYLAFSEPGVLSLDEFVLNTEAHPFRLR